MEIDPRRQKTLPDFTVTEAEWGIRAVDTRKSSGGAAGCL